MTSKIYGDNDESCLNKISLNEKNNKGIGNTPMIKINYRYNNKEKSVFADDNKKYLSTDLFKPIDEDKEFISNKIELISYENI